MKKTNCLRNKNDLISMVILSKGNFKNLSISCKFLDFLSSHLLENVYVLFSSLGFIGLNL